MAEIVTMPRLSDTMTEGTVAKWHKKEGDKVKEGDLLAEIETDKATMEFESFQEGVLLYIGVNEGETAPVDSILAILGEEGEDISALIDGKSSDQPVESKDTEKKASDEKSPQNLASKSEKEDPSEEDTEEIETEGKRIKISPLARRLAKEKGIDINQLKGTGEGGRIIKRDIENFKPEEAPKQAAAEESKAEAPAPSYPKETTYTPGPSGAPYTEEPISQMRKTIARRLAESKFSAPHFYLTIEIDMDKAMEVRRMLNEISETKISFNDLVIKAAALALRKHPKINASWLGEKIRYNHDINIGVAVAVEEGLLVPVVRHADRKGLSTIAAEIKEYAQKAKNKKLQPSDWEGNTFTISNLGMFGIDEFTAIINPPDACIMAVGGIRQVPVVKNGEIVPGHVMKVTLSCDHRAVDGATGAAFLQTFKSLLEDPMKMML
ncbi:pyruvate dehydrogenase complex dihydrolipoamide acetyltransferase [Schleiferia thermophila]|jgi:pyruvate dehydrogenase E2 component (dihydrolipoamide acetyltransferase)|uniref:Acetyltransferase component of pyruvate dehydrogenase complex n=1 Tax=Schleiferia thermophila TaxID=884107 RepID=A0A369AB66_9FLAO|nr:pyruvate dehydrogenase complex dihydrolipoamide acetyltransferase [Schleiferia thermophila]KFD39916.1 dihydrolipoamide acyltransferase [Schleiferia thermophila str. Yellowstone]RCX05317.1 pyruvate dehydrogenase E2 component (dihydrolipoamide acetyltransferase) [Schleiferia thermophila]GCD79175.1 dihydrolipoamide acetyltransferase component of pyruvate dehydrogenase complex [Schleiferia thermophila]